MTVAKMAKLWAVDMSAAAAEVANQRSASHEPLSATPVMHPTRSSSYQAASRVRTAVSALC
ncbi:MAG: hypothetical protein M3N82_09030, partial [Pseudomonadota bacterium]|nr:hypothetical protein [Pseudomonadota bacterium]